MPQDYLPFLMLICPACCRSVPAPSIPISYRKFHNPVRQLRPSSPSSIIARSALPAATGLPATIASWSAPIAVITSVAPTITDPVQKDLHHLRAVILSGVRSGGRSRRICGCFCISVFSYQLQSGRIKTDRSPLQFPISRHIYPRLAAISPGEAAGSSRARASTLRASPVSAIPAASPSSTQRLSPPATVIASTSSSKTMRMRT